MPSSLSEAFRSYSSAIVTGGSSGLGRAFIRNGLKLHAGMPICNVSRTSPEDFRDLKSLHHIGCDLGRETEVEHAAGQLQSWLEKTPRGRVMLINNSGFGAYGHFPEPNLSRSLSMIDLNVRAVVHLTGLLLPVLKQRGGTIMTIASTAAFQPLPYAATYAATKAFVLHWTVALNEELRGTGVNAIAVCPGPTKTNFFTTAGLGTAEISPSLSMTADEVVEIAMKAAHAGRSQVVTGWKNAFMAAIASRAPKPFAARIARGLLARYRMSVR